MIGCLPFFLHIFHFFSQPFDFRTQKRYFGFVLTLFTIIFESFGDVHGGSLELANFPSEFLRKFFFFFENSFNLSGSKVKKMSTVRHRGRPFELLLIFLLRIHMLLFVYKHSRAIYL